MAIQPALSSEAAAYSERRTGAAIRKPREYTGRERVPATRRIFEIVVAATTLLLAAPLMLLIAVAIRMVSPGPAIYASRRLGVNRQLFTFYKFRTMYADAPERFPELYAYKFADSDSHTIKFKVDNDPRIIPFGKWLRASSLDELPNLWSVLVGDMALVGPRPEVPAMLPYYPDEMLQKFAVRPGVTGLAQISGRGDLLFHQTVACDLEYVESRSVAFDLKILFKTIAAVFTRRGAV